MTMAAALVLALLSISVLVGLLALSIVLGRSARTRSVRRRARVSAPARPLLLALMAQDSREEGDLLLDELLRIDERSWRALEPTVAEMLGKLRGDSHRALRQLVERRGTVAVARRRSSRVGAVGRARAAELLGGLEDPKVTDDLVRLLADRDPEVRQVAARALGRCGDALAAAPLLHALEGGSVPPRVVAQALLRLGPRAQPALVAALEEPDELVRAVAVEILGLSGAVTASRAIEQALANDPSTEVRIRAARSLGRVGLPSSLLTLLAATLETCPVPLRVVAARALGDLGHPGAVSRLRELVGDPVHRVASNAARSLGVLGPGGEAALQQLAAGAEDSPAASHAREILARRALTQGPRSAAGPRGA